MRSRFSMGSYTAPYAVCSDTPKTSASMTFKPPAVYRDLSLQEEGPREPQQEALQKIAASIIQKAWRRYMCREVFKYFKELISHCNQQDPQSILKAVNPREAKLLDAAAGAFIRFRLGGITFPPNIYYKIYTHRPIADVCASSPKDYTQPGLKQPVARQTNSGWPLMQGDRSGWYQRMENNSWRLFCSKAVPRSEHMEISANKKMDFHYCKLQRQQDVVRWRKMRKIEWLKQMYSRGCLRIHAAHRHMATVENSALEVMDTIEEKGGDEILEWELDQLLAWTNTLSFEEYIEDWRHLACSHSSEPSKEFGNIAKLSDWDELQWASEAFKDQSKRGSSFKV